jgi:hypothetical protein
MLLKPQKVGLFWVLIAISIGIFGCGNTDDVMPSAELAARIEAGTAPLILDVRTPEEYAAEHIPGAVNISHTELAGRLAELDAYKNKEIVVHCRSGAMAGKRLPCRVAVKTQISSDRQCPNNGDITQFQG